MILAVHSQDLGLQLATSIRCLRVMTNWEDKQLPVPAVGAFVELLINMHSLMWATLGMLLHGTIKDVGWLISKRGWIGDFANADWRVLFPNATVTHLPALQSDHRPLLLELSPVNEGLPKPFRFESMWVTHPDTSYIIQEAWNRK